MFIWSFLLCNLNVKGQNLTNGFSGNHIDADSLGNWCGTAKQTYTTSGQDAYIYFRSDKMVEATRFKICYKAIKLGKSLYP